VAIAGGGSVAEELQARRARGHLPANIELLGWVQGETRARELAAADALVLPTYTEGFPNVLLEAMACALPVIATPVGAIPDVLTHGETGLLVPPRSVDPLAHAMDELRQRPEQAAAMGLRGLERVRARFDRAVAVATLLSILKG
jgi:glycosyltransferase involved in cell wall biosynthesis